MLVTTKELLRLANAQNKAIGAFNISGLETLQAVIQAAEKMEEPVIIQFAQVYEEECVMNLDIIGPIMVMEAQKANVPVAVHLDHGIELNFIERALEMGFTSIMYDGSSLTYDENIAYTNMAVQLSRKYGVSVEAEIGVMTGLILNDEKITENRVVDRRMYTDPLIAQDFVEKTGVDCLACAFGTVHGLYKTKSKLDYALVKELDDMIGVPIVKHDGSGVSEEDYDIVIENGVRKINYYTYMAKSGGEAVKQYCKSHDDVLYIHDIANIAIEAMQKNVEEAIRIFNHRKGEKR